MREHTYFPNWESYPKDGGVVRVTRDSRFPEVEQAFADDPEEKLPSSYEVLYRNCLIEFKPGPDEGTWEVVATNSCGDLLWSASTALWCPQMPKDGIMRFSHAIQEARDVFKMGEE